MNTSSPMPESKFSTLDYGTKPSTDQLETIVVSLDPNLILGDFALAYANELVRRNPSRADAVNLTSDELEYYFKALLSIRVASISGSTKYWREAKKLYIPTWIQFVMTTIGEVIDVDKGLRIVPSYKTDIDMSTLLDISSRLRTFIPDGVTMHLDAFPRESSGDIEVMSMAVIDNFVRSMDAKAHPISSYVSAFIGAKIEEEAAFKILYRVRYDDVSFIKTMLLHEEALI